MVPTRLVTIFVGVCAIVLCAGVASGEVGVGEIIFGTGALVVITRIMAGRRGCQGEGQDGLSAEQAQRIEARLSELERRLTDIQEVQIALSERADYPPARTKTGEG